jgi:hypothetical protein
MKSLFLGVAFIVLVGLGGFFYRNAVEYSARPIACPVEKFVCPDGTQLTHIGISCTFPLCPPPNVTLADLGISFAVPAGFSAGGGAAGVIAGYRMPSEGSSEYSDIFIRRFPIQASSSAVATIQKSSINLTSELPVSPTAFTSTSLGAHQFTIVTVERFEGVVDVAYYMARNSDVLRFDAIDRGVDWTNPNLDITALPAQAAVRKLLTTLQGE